MNYDVIVVGAGHAGIEAAYGPAKLGAKTLLLTMNMDQIGAMSCNPAIGGLGKSQLAREVDALGGLMCLMADETAMQYRILNESKGSAVRATRIQVDRHEYRASMKDFLEKVDNLSIKQAQITKLLFEGGRLAGVVTALNQIFKAPAVVITTGTFMNGKAHIGRENFASGRAGEPPSVGLSSYLASIGVKIGRLKTGTVPRVDRRTIDFSKTEEQESHKQCAPLSHWKNSIRNDLVSAHIAYTTPETHDIIRAHLHESALYSGIIESRGPRYCPSVEDKVVRFADKSRHQVFLEREGRRTQEVYVGGLSTSLPYSAQLKFLRTIPGLEAVEIIRPGYAIEYDTIDANQLDHGLQLKEMPGLFFAGQVNGTSGYEEAAAQGLLAGVNAACFALGKESFRLDRSEAYLGVMVDDLVTKKHSEPYRMFTSRSEWRLLLRQDNADRRLGEKAYDLGLITETQMEKLQRDWSRRDSLKEKIEAQVFYPKAEFNECLLACGEAALKTAVSAADLLRRPSLTIERVSSWMGLSVDDYSDEDLRYIESEIKYVGYIEQAKLRLRQLNRMIDQKFPKDFDFKVPGLSREASEILLQARPESLVEASRIPAVTPATVSILAIALARRQNNSSDLDKAACRDAHNFEIISKSCSDDSCQKTAGES